jgi:CheY-like chemotaxis protein
LEKNGYRVLLAASGSEGLEVARAHHGDIHLVVTDVVMPKMGGGEFGGEIGSICPKARVLYLSGYTEDAIADHGVLKPGIDFLQKPVVAKKLLRKVREILDRP